jgi:hypothetical protein
MRGWIAGCVVATVLALPSGCSTMRGRLARMLPDSQGYDDGTDSSDPWIAEGASEGRAEFTKEKEADPFGIKPLFMSQKARDIEKNLGIE